MRVIGERLTWHREACRTYCTLWKRQAEHCSHGREKTRPPLRVHNIAKN